MKRLRQVSWRARGSVLIFLLLFFCPCESAPPWLEPTPLEKFVDCQWPNDKEVLEGSQANGTCHLISTSASPAPYSLADLTLKFPSNFTRMLTKNRTVLTVTFSFQHRPEHDYQKLIYHWPNSSYGQQDVSFHVVGNISETSESTKPLMPNNILCEIQNWQEMMCKWTPTVREQQDWVHNSKVTNMLEWRKGSEAFKQCADPLENGCRWKVNSIPEDVTSVTVGDILEVRVMVSYTNRSHEFPSDHKFINTSAIVRPSPLGDMLANETERDVDVIWTHPAPGQCIKCNIKAVSTFETRQTEMAFKESKVKVTFKKLIPNTKYNISASCRSCSSNLWSKVTYNIKHTTPRVPEHHPLLRADALEIKECPDIYCPITFYWQPLLRQKQNGDHFVYEVKSSQGYHFNTTRFSTIFVIDTNQAFDIQVSAINTVGRAAGNPNVVSLHPKDLGKAADFAVEAINDSVVLLEVEGEKQNFTVFWCPKRTSAEQGNPGQCQNYFNWTSPQEGHNNNFTLTLPQGQGHTFKNYWFAVSTESSRFISWRSCTFDLRKAPTPPEVDKHPEQKSGSLHLVWKHSPSEGQLPAFSDHYIISHCPVETCLQDSQSFTNASCSEPPVTIKVPRQKKNHNIENLETGTSYVAWLTSVSRNGKISRASEVVCHAVLAPLFTGWVLAGTIVGCVLLVFFLITAIYFMKIRCCKVKDWLKGHGMSINVPERQKFSSQKTLTDEQIRPSSASRGITNSMSSFDSGLGTISQSDYHHTFSMPMIRGMSSESEADEVFDDSHGENLAAMGGKHYPQTFQTLPTLCEGRPLKQMGKPGISTRSLASKGSGYNTSLGSYVLQPGGADSIKSSPSKDSDYTLPDEALHSNAPINTSNSNNNDHCSSLEDIRSNISCKSLPLGDLSYISTEDLADGNNIVIPREILTSPDQGYVVNNMANSQTKPYSGSRSSLSKSHSSSHDSINSPSVTLEAGQNCAHYVVHPEEHSPKPSELRITIPNESTDYVQRDQGPCECDPSVSISLGHTDTNGYVVNPTDTPKTFSGSTNHSQATTGPKDLSSYTPVSNLSSVSIPSSSTGQDVTPPTVNNVVSNKDTGNLQPNSGYVALPTSGGSIISPLRQCEPTGDSHVDNPNPSSVPVVLNNAGYVALPSTSPPNVSSSSHPLSYSSPDRITIPIPVPIDASTPIPSPSYVSSPSVNIPAISSGGYVTSPNVATFKNHSSDNAAAHNAATGYVDATRLSPSLNKSQSTENHDATPQPTVGYASLPIVPASNHVNTSPKPGGDLSSNYAATPETSKSSSVVVPSGSDYAATTNLSTGSHIPVPSINIPIPQVSFNSQVESPSGYVLSPISPSTSKDDATPSHSQAEQVDAPSVGSGYAAAPSNYAPNPTSSGYVACPSKTISQELSPNTSATFATPPNAAGYVSAPEVATLPSSQCGSAYSAMPLTSSTPISMAIPIPNLSISIDDLSSPDFGCMVTPSSASASRPPVPEVDYTGVPSLSKDSTGYVTAPVAPSNYVTSSPSGYTPEPSTNPIESISNSGPGYVAPNLTSDPEYEAPASPTLNPHEDLPSPTSYKASPFSNGYVAVPSTSPPTDVACLDTSSDYVSSPDTTVSIEDTAETALLPPADYTATPDVLPMSKSYVATPDLLPPPPDLLPVTDCGALSPNFTVASDYSDLPRENSVKSSNTPGGELSSVKDSKTITPSGDYIGTPTSVSNSTSLDSTESSNSHVTTPGSSVENSVTSPSSNGYVTLPTSSHMTESTDENIQAKTEIPNGHDIPALTMNGYVTLPDTSSPKPSSDLISSKTGPECDGYVSTPSSYVGAPQVQPDGDTAKSIPQVNGYVVSPSHPVNGVATTLPSSPGDYTSSSDAPVNGYVTAPVTKGPVAPAKLSNGYVAAPPSVNGLVNSPISKSDCLDDNFSSSTNVGNSGSDYATIPESAAKTPSAKRSEEPSKKITEQTMNGYIAIPSVVQNSDPKSCNEQSSDYVTNQPQSIVKPNFVVAV